MRGRSFTKVQKLQILRRAGYQCQSCATALSAANFEADHKLPYSLGGPTELHNALALCVTCNRRKSNKPHQDQDG